MSHRISIHVWHVWLYYSYTLVYKLYDRNLMYISNNYYYVYTLFCSRHKMSIYINLSNSTYFVLFSHLNFVSLLFKLTFYKQCIVIYNCINIFKIKSNWKISVIRVLILNKRPQRLIQERYFARPISIPADRHSRTVVCMQSNFWESLLYFGDTILNILFITVHESSGMMTRK